MKPQQSELYKLYKKICEGKISYCKAGKDHGVSDNAVRKRFKTAGRTLPKKIKGRIDYICSYCKKTFEDDYSRQNDSKSGMHFCDRSCMSEYAKENKDFNSVKNIYEG